MNVSSLYWLPYWRAHLYACGCSRCFRQCNMLVVTCECLISQAKFEFHHGDYEKQFLHVLSRKDKTGIVVNNPNQSVFLFIDRQHLQVNFFFFLVNHTRAHFKSLLVSKLFSVRYLILICPFSIALFLKLLKNQETDVLILTWNTGSQTAACQIYMGSFSKSHEFSLQ